MLAKLVTYISQNYAGTLDSGLTCTCKYHCSHDIAFSSFSPINKPLLFRPALISNSVVDLGRFQGFHGTPFGFSFDKEAWPSTKPNYLDCNH